MSQLVETEQALVAVATLVKYIIEASKDGLNMADGTAIVTKLISDIEFRTIFMDGITGISKIPVEVKAELADPKVEDILAVIAKVALVFRTKV